MSKKISSLLFLILSFGLLVVYQNCSQPIEEFDLSSNDFKVNATSFSLATSSTTLVEGDNISLQVTGNQSANVSIVWYLNNQMIHGQFGRVLSIPIATINDSGAYRAEVLYDGKTISLDPIYIVVQSSNGGSGTNTNNNFIWQSQICSDGVRQVQCIDTINSNAQVADNSCTGTKPDSNCSWLSWETSTCSGSNREVNCKDNNSGQIVDSARCKPSEKPSTQCGYIWKASQCSNATRSVTCINSTNNNTVANSLCDAASKPTSSCYWFVWSTSACVNGSRTVTCINKHENNTVVANSHCSSSTKPSSTCSANLCGNGVLNSGEVCDPGITYPSPLRCSLTCTQYIIDNYNGFPIP